MLLTCCADVIDCFQGNGGRKTEDSRQYCTVFGLLQVIGQYQQSGETGQKAIDIARLHRLLEEDTRAVPWKSENCK